MRRRVKEFVEIRDHRSLDQLIARLVEVRDSLPEHSEAEMKLRGDDVFGRTLTITYFRERTAEEAECVQRYAPAFDGVEAPQVDRLQQDPIRRPSVFEGNARMVA